MLPSLSVCRNPAVGALQSIQELSKREVLTALSMRAFGTSDNQKNSARNDYIRRGLWVEKEAMDAYLLRTLATTQKFVNCAELSSIEKTQFQALKMWHQHRYTPQKSNLLPFIQLEAVGKTFESWGGDYLNGQEIACYLEEGVVGPINIGTLNQNVLRPIAEKFHNFYTNHHRNLGSVYTMLNNKCMLDLATNSTILAKVSSILGDNIMLANMTVNALAPGQGKSTTETGGMVDALNCHSDLSSGSQYHFEPDTDWIKNLALNNQCVNVWVSVSGTDPMNAPLYFFPKTHQWEIPTPLTYLDLAGNDPDPVLKLLSFRQGSAVRRIGLYNEEYQYLLSSRYKPLLSQILQTEIYTQPGDCILFNAHTRHGSGVNLSSKPRLAITMRFNTAMTEAGGMESAGSVLTLTERKALGILGDKKKPMIQVMGNKHHSNNVPVDISHLKNRTSS